MMRRGLTDAVYQGLTGQRRQRQTTSGVYADSKRAFGTWKEVARQAGVSERTLRRIRAGSKPSAATKGKLDQLARNSSVRRAGIKPGKAKQINQANNAGARVKITGDMGPRGYGAGSYHRRRMLDFSAPPEGMQALEAAYANGDDEALRQVMSGLVEDHAWSDWTPMGGWDFGDIDSFSFDPDV